MGWSGGGHRIISTSTRYINISNFFYPVYPWHAMTFMDLICTALADPAFDHGSPTASPSTLGELRWTLNSRLEQSITRAEKDVAELITSWAMRVVKTGHDKQVVKAAHVSPDPKVHTKGTPSPPKKKHIA